MSKLTKIGLPIALLFVWVLTSSGILSVDRMILQMESQSLHRGKVVRIKADLYYQAMTGRLLTNYLIPEGSIIITNRKGEVVIYNKKENSVRYMQGAEFSTEANLIHFFLQGMTHDLGLRDMGFSLTNTEVRDGLVITEWFPPANLYGMFSHIKLVHQDFLPIYAAYYDAQEKLVKKVYYSNFQNIFDVALPTLITEFQYVGNDSIVNRIRFSNIRVNQNANSQWFNFEIPVDAKKIQ